MSLERANKFHLTQPIALIAGIAFSISLLLTSCGRGEIEQTSTPTRQASNETELAFETIEQSTFAGTGQYYEDIEPGLMIISNESDIDKLDELVTTAAKAKLHDLNYGNIIALIVFQGWKISGDYAVQIERITLAENTINVYAQFHEPQPGQEVSAEITSPYHLVQVQKNGDWDQEFLFQVVVDGTIVDALNHFIP